MPMLYRFVIRDAVIVAVAAIAWMLLAARSAGAGFVADLSGWIVGLLLFACAYVAHEWSHYLGAILSGGRADIGDNLASGFLFSFGTEGNTLGTFVAMSLSGFVATGAAVAFFYFGLPDEYLATRVARGGALFLTMLGVVLEVPLLLYGLFTRSVPKQAAVLPAEPEPL
ncbi:MAG: hypothetical protein AAGC67_19710 [Myxococcota bacterium]